MDKLEKARRLQAMLEQIAGKPGKEGLESIARTAAKTPGALESVGGGGPQAQVQTGLEKLADNRPHDVMPIEPAQPRGDRDAGKPAGRLRPRRIELPTLAGMSQTLKAISSGSDIVI